MTQAQEIEVKFAGLTEKQAAAMPRRSLPSEGLLDDATKLVTSRLGPDRFRVAGTAEMAGLDTRLDTPTAKARCAALVRRYEQLFPGVADTKTHCRTLDSNSSKRSGRLSSAEGRRNPKFTRFSLRERSPLYMPPSCPIVTWLSSMIMSALGGR